MKLRVRTCKELRWPDGSPRGGGGYVVDPSAPGEAARIAGQEGVLEEVPDWIMADPLPAEPPAPASVKKAKKKTKRKGLLRRKKKDDA